MPEIEYAYACGAAALEGYRSLSRHSGVPVEEVARLAVAGELRSLFGRDGRLRPREELRSRFGPDGRLRPRLNTAPGGSSPAKAAVGDPRSELLRLRAKRDAWQ